MRMVMTDPSELVAFLLARFGELESAARAADVRLRDPAWFAHPVALTCPPSYRVRSVEGKRPIAMAQDVTVIDGEHLDGRPDPTGIVDGEAVAQHIALHDPAYVLADVAAKRRIARHIMVAVPVLDLLEPDYAHALGLLLRELASPFAAHPDFNPEWGL